LGRWTSADPAGIKGGTNLYRYARDNPVQWVDPDGLAPQAADPRVQQVAQLSAQKAQIVADIGEVSRRLHKASETVMNVRGQVLHDKPGYFSEEAKALRSAEGYVKQLLKQSGKLANQLQKVEKEIRAIKTALVNLPGEEGLSAYLDALEAEGTESMKAAAAESREVFMSKSDRLKAKFDALEEAEAAAARKGTGKKGGGGGPEGGGSSGGSPPPDKPPPPPERPGGGGGSGKGAKPASAPEVPAGAGTAAEARGLSRFLPLGKKALRVIGRGVVIFGAADMGYRFITRGPKGVSEAVEETIVLPFEITIEGGKFMGEQIEKGVNWMRQKNRGH
jgi:hypothetical protein